MARDDNDDNVRYLDRRTFEPAVADSRIQIREGEGQLRVDFLSEEPVAALLRAAADWLDANPGATVIALNVQYIEEGDTRQHLLEMVTDG
jgi:hypothetical protein